MSTESADSTGAGQTNPSVAFECRVCDYTSDEYGDTHTHTVADLADRLAAAQSDVAELSRLRRENAILEARLRGARRRVERMQRFNLRSEEDKGRLWQELRDRCATAEARLAAVEAVLPAHHWWTGPSPNGAALVAEIRAALLLTASEPEQADLPEQPVLVQEPPC